MLIYYNNQLIEVKKHATLYDVVEDRETIEHKAVWLNGEHVPLEDFKETILNEKDRLKIVRIRGGG